MTLQNLDSAQADMRAAYCSGAAGMLASALVWAAAAVIAALVDVQRGVWTLLLGGALIHPLAVLVSRLAGRSGRHARDNPLGGLAAASTAWLVFMLPLAFVVFLVDATWFFPAMLLVIGGRYLVFATLYGLRLYRFAGLALAALAWPLALGRSPPELSAAAGALIEAGFAVALFLRDRRDVRAAAAVAHGDHA